MHIQDAGGQRKYRSVKNGMGGGDIKFIQELKERHGRISFMEIFLAWISHFKLDEIAIPSNLKEDTEISGGIRLKKRCEVLRKRIGIIIDLEGFTLMSKTAASSAISLRILIGLLTKFRKQAPTTVSNRKKEGT